MIKSKKAHVSSGCRIGLILHRLKTTREGFAGPGKTGEKGEGSLVAVPRGGSEDDRSSRKL